MSSRCQAKRGVGQREEGSPHQEPPSERNLILVRYTRCLVALHIAGILGCIRLDERRKRVLLAFPTRLFETQHLRGRIASFARMFAGRSHRLAKSCLECRRVFCCQRASRTSLNSILTEPCSGHIRWPLFDLTPEATSSKGTLRLAQSTGAAVRGTFAVAVRAISFPLRVS